MVGGWLTGGWLEWGGEREEQACPPAAVAACRRADREDNSRWVVPALGGLGSWLIQGYVPGTVLSALPADKDSRGVEETK